MKKSLLLLSIALCVLTSSRGAGSSGQFLLSGIKAFYYPFSKLEIFFCVWQKSPSHPTVPFLQMSWFTMTKAECLSSSSSTGRALQYSPSPLPLWLKLGILERGHQTGTSLQQQQLFCAPQTPPWSVKQLHICWGESHSFTHISFCSAGQKGKCIFSACILRRLSISALNWLHTLGM